MSTILPSFSHSSLLSRVIPSIRSSSFVCEQRRRTPRRCRVITEHCLPRMSAFRAEDIQEFGPSGEPVSRRQSLNVDNACRQQEEPVITSVSLNLRGSVALPSIESLSRYMRDLRPKLDYLGPQAREEILSALEVANVSHENQKRKSGEPYIVHPVAVAGILAELRMDRDSIVAGLLHDTVEDTPLTLREVEMLFGAEVRRIVEGETKISKLASKVHGQNARAFVKPVEDRANPTHRIIAEQEKQADNLRGMFLAMTEDVRVIIVKLADRLHNMRTLEHMKPEKRKKIAKETLEFFAPLAHRLGMCRIKSELEELSFRHLYPEEYNELKGEVEAMKRRSRFDHYLREARAVLLEQLDKDVMLGTMSKKVEVLCTTKSLYAIYKRRLAGESLSSMVDIAKLCVIIDAQGDDSTVPCYHVLGRVHSHWKPLLKHLKDYIAYPKPNGYQSLHTTVLLGQRQDFFAVEVQIRTKEMHHVAEEGIAAELFRDPALYPTVGASEAGIDANGCLDPEWRKRTQGWLISIRDYIDSFSSSRDLVDAVRRDLLGNRVYVFTPKGRIIDLPKGSTPIDLAYKIHTDVGHRMIGARVNGKMVGLDYKLQNADVVKVIGSNSSPGPSNEWMGYAKSRTARQRIQRYLKDRDRDNMLDRGRVLLESAATKRGHPKPSESQLSELVPRLSAVLSASYGIRGVKTVDDLYVGIAKGTLEESGFKLDDIALSMLYDKDYAITESAPFFGSEESALNQMNSATPILESASCCHPLRGDEVMGIRDSTEDGEPSVVIHRMHCEHLLTELRQRPVSSRVVGVRWTHKLSEQNNVVSTELGTGAIEPVGPGRGKPAMPARVMVIARDCDGLLSYVSGVVSGMGRSIRRAYTATDPVTVEATLAFEVLVEDIIQLESIIDRIHTLDEVQDVRRVGPNEGEEFFPEQWTGRFAKRPPRRRLDSDEAEIDELHIDGA